MINSVRTVDVIATLECTAIEKDGRRFPLKLSIGRPYQSGKGHSSNWACSVRIDPLYTNLKDIVGLDSFQALCLALRLAVELLDGFVQRGGQLLDDDGSSIPLDSYALLSKTK